MGEPLKSRIVATVLSCVAIVAGLLAGLCAHMSAAIIASMSLERTEAGEHSASTWGFFAAIFGGLLVVTGPPAVLAWVYQLRWRFRRRPAQWAHAPSPAAGDAKPPTVWTQD